MNKICTFLLLLLALPIIGLARSQDDKKNLLSYCFQVPELREILSGSPGEIVVMQHGISFSFNENINFAGKDVLFMGKDEINRQQIESYFLFWRFDITDESAFIEYTLRLDEKEHIATRLELGKRAGSWEVINSTSERRSI